ncbi:MAG: hypothetical protein MEQ84_08725 [Mesorhizobium sp.]|nr:hypothetical protein [Mesorhizobium sp.]
MATTGAASWLIARQVLPDDALSSLQPDSLDIGGTVLLALSLGTYALAAPTQARAQAHC